MYFCRTPKTFIIMKQFVFIVVLLISSIATTASSQESVPTEGKHRVYCELLGTINFAHTKVKIQVDFGQKVTWMHDSQLVDSSGKKIVFNSMVDGMNYMGKFGWKFAQAYAMTTGTTGQHFLYHWLLYKDIVEESEIVEGLMTMDQYKALLSEQE